MGVLCFALVLPVSAQNRVEIDPNTKIEGGADVRGSGANAGAGARSDNKIESESRVERREEPREDERGNVAGPDRTAAEKDKPVSARKPQERELEDASKGATKPQQ
jgi:hypothetical protein